MPNRHDAAASYAIHLRCRALGISLDHACRLAAAADSLDSRSIKRVLGLDLVRSKIPRRWVWMAAKTCSVSYRLEITEEELADILSNGTVPDKFISHIGHLLDEAPIQVVVMAVEQVAAAKSLPIIEVWRNIESISQSIGSRRRSAWTLE